MADDDLSPETEAAPARPATANPSISVNPLVRPSDLAVRPGFRNPPNKGTAAMKKPRKK